MPEETNEGTGGGRPDYILKCQHKGTKRHTQAGAAWVRVVNGKQCLRIELNPCVVLQANSDIYMTLFPNDRDE
jgi:hypothetical protein